MPPTDPNARLERNEKAIWLLFFFYACLLFTLLPLQSLWLDEITQTFVTRYSTLDTLLRVDIRRLAGQVPLAFLLQHFSITLFGYSTFAARVPAALMSLLAYMGVYQLAKRANITRLWLCLGLFATLPLQLRYATEARPYSQALCVAVWLTVLFLQLREHPRKGVFWAYTALSVLGLHTQPFIVFIMASHCVYALIELNITRRWHLLRDAVLATALSVLLFLPWYLYAKAGWKGDIIGSDLHFHAGLKLPLEIARELTGGGYIETLLIVALSIYALRFAPISKLSKWFWALAAIVPIPLVLLTDAAFDYFFAIRQFIFVLPPLIVLTTLGLEMLYRNNKPRVAAFLAILLLALNIGYSIRWFTKPREDWGIAAAKLDSARSAGACLVFLPVGSAYYYDFYVPGLEHSSCDSTKLSNFKTVVVATSPYLRDPASEAATRERLQAQGFGLAPVDKVQEPLISIFKHP